MTSGQPHEATHSYLGCAEPSWSGAVPERQLSGLLNLTCLLSERVYLSDVHLGDNSNFYHSYLKNNPNGLYSKLRSLTELGLTRLLLRDMSFRPNSRTPIIKCDTFSDVFRSWVAQDPVSAWINQDIDEERAKYFQDLDSWALGKAVERYDYQSVKLDFIQTARKACSSQEKPWFVNAVRRLPPRIRSGYLEIIDRDWFSLSDIYSFLHSNGISGSHKFLLYNGLLNEIAYGASIGASLVGTDCNNTQFEDVFWTNETTDALSISLTSKDGDAIVHEILDRAAAVLDAPALSILSRLTGEEIAALRSADKEYFELLDLSHDPFFVGATLDFERRFVSAAAEYWDSICDYLASHHPSASQQPTKLAIMLGSLPGPFRRISKSFFSFAVNVGPTVAKELLPGAKPLANVGEQFSRNLSLRFLFLCDTNELRLIRSVIPDRSWLARPSAAIAKRSR